MACSLFSVAIQFFFIGNCQLGNSVAVLGPKLGNYGSKLGNSAVAVLGLRNLGNFGILVSYILILVQFLEEKQNFRLRRAYSSNNCKFV